MSSNVLLFLLPLYLLGTLAIVGAVLAILRYQRRPRGCPTCATCGYDLTAHVENPTTCPECGRGLNEVGAILPSGHREPLTVTRKILLMTVAMVALALLVTPIVNTMLPPYSAYGLNSTWASPSSKAYNQLAITANTNAMFRPLPIARRTTVALTDLDGVVHTMTIDSKQMMARYAAPSGSTHEWPLGEAGETIAAVKAWFAAIGIATDDPSRVRRDIDSLATHLHDPGAFIRVLPGTGVVPASIADRYPGLPFGNNTKTVSQAAIRQVWRVPLLAAPWLVLLGIGVAVLLVGRTET